MGRAENRSDELVLKQLQDLELLLSGKTQKSINIFLEAP